MARVKVRLADNIARVVFIETAATEGATLGRDVRLPNGQVGTPATIREWLGGAGGDAGESGIAHRSLSGLTRGNDHPQYTMWAKEETIKAPWHHVRELDVSIGGVTQWDVNDTRVHQNVPLIVTNDAGIRVDNPTEANAGIELTTFGTADPNGVGNQLAFWERGSKNWGFRLRHTGELVDQGDLDFYRHAGDSVGALFMRFTRNSSQIQLAAGSAAEPALTTFDDLNTGVFWIANNRLGLAASTIEQAANVAGSAGYISNNANVSGTSGFSAADSAGALRARFGWSNVFSRAFINMNVAANLTLQQGGTVGWEFTSTRNWLGRDGCELQLGTGGDLRLFHNGTNSTIRNDTGNLSFFSSATEVLRIPQTNPRLQAHAGAVATPSYAFYGDPNTGMYSAGADILGFSTGGVARVHIVPAGGVALGTVSPAYDTPGSLTLYGGASYSAIHMTNATSGVGATDGFIIAQQSDNSVDIRNYENEQIRLSTNNTVRLRIMGDGNIGHGLTPTGQGNRIFHIGSSTTTALHLTSAATGDGATNGFAIQVWSNAATYLWNYENTFTSFGVNSLEKMRLSPDALSLNSGVVLSLVNRVALSAPETAWLSLNRAGHFTSGIFTPGLFRADGGFAISSYGISAPTNYGSIAVTGALGSYCGVRLQGGSNKATFMEHSTSNGLGVYRVGTSTWSWYDDGVNFTVGYPIRAGTNIPYTRVISGGANGGGRITISTSAPSGTPTNGDIWLQREA